MGPAPMMRMVAMSVLLGMVSVVGRQFGARIKKGRAAGLPAGTRPLCRKGAERARPPSCPDYLDEILSGVKGRPPCPRPAGATPRRFK
jgi:hypothetical protein